MAQIADFGLSRSIAHSRSRRTTSSGGAGTDCWMPPEGLAGKCGDPASLTFSYDVHPTGSLLYCAGPRRAAERSWCFASRFVFRRGFRAGAAAAWRA
jgi:serine/threonine protein kinase